MLKSKTRWVVQPTDLKKKEELAESLQVSSLVASLLVNRGYHTVEDAKAFLWTSQSEFHDPFLLNDMNVAVNRIHQAIENHESILIFGDYDCDGVTSTTVLMKALQELGATVDFYIPNRFTEGYGPNEGAFRYAHEMGVTLIITVDTGIAALHEARVASELGLDLIITDHHEPGPELPEAFAIIHPKRKDSTYPFHDLAGVGVAFKLAHALLGRMPEHLLAFAAIGTIADLVPLKGENRLLAKQGIECLKTFEHPGLKALLRLAGAKQEEINEETIGFSIAPRINAVGRLDSADAAAHLLLTEDRDEAEMLAEEIDMCNKERQEIVSSIAAEAIEMVEKDFPIEENSCLVIGKEGWNAGVIGIVASKLVEKFYRPTIVLSFDREKGLAKGSARSIAGFDLFQNLSTCRDLLPHFGGHPMAAGMTLKLEDVEKLRIRMNALANEKLQPEDFIPVTNIDVEIRVEEVSLQSIEEMSMLAPYGMGNPKPRLFIKDASVNGLKKIGSEQTHLKLVLGQNEATLDAVGFGLGSVFNHIAPDSKLSVIGELSINEWNSLKKPQIFLQDVSISSYQLFDCRGSKQHLRMMNDLPSKDTKLVFFDEKHFPLFQSLFKNRELVFIPSIDDAKGLVLDDCYTVLLDMPPSRDMLSALFSGKSPARIYTHFYTEESGYFSTMPTREHFKSYYGILLKKSPFDLMKHGDALAKYKGWTRDVIDFMSEVFFELDFVTIRNGLISVNKGVTKRDLSDSTVYQRKLAYFQLENELLYSSFQQLKSLFDEILQETVGNEEEVKKWI